MIRTKVKSISRLQELVSLPREPTGDNLIIRRPAFCRATAKRAVMSSARYDPAAITWYEPTCAVWLVTPAAALNT